MKFFQDELADHTRVLEQTLAADGPLLEQLVVLFVATFRRGNKILFCGNGGSAADSQHIAAEFINRFRFNRAPLPALALTVDSSVLTCIGNDAAFDQIVSKQVEALAQAGDVVVGISTSGRSANVLKALSAARAKEAVAVGFTGARGKAHMAPLCDHCFAVASVDTARIQEGHEFAFHSIAARVERLMFPELAGESMA
jgi:D-sedoheptulose 7-phosphate isomerase